MRAESLQWIVQECRFKPKTIQVLAILWCDGLTRVGAARWLQVKASTVQKLEARAKARMKREYDRADEGGRLLWAAMFAEPDESLPLEGDDHVKALLFSMRGPAPSCPTSPEYDVLGREIGRRPPIVSVGQARWALGAAAEQRKQEYREAELRQQQRDEQARQRLLKEERERRRANSQGLVDGAAICLS